MLEFNVSYNSRYISDFNRKKLKNREIVIGQHCYSCTAGSGSSCSATVA
ncbi:MAG: DUF3641 domain-containing protein [Segetibacter sp.]